MKKILSGWLYVLGVHLLSLLLLTSIRAILYFVNAHHLDGIIVGDGWMMRAFTRGVWFDNILVSYLTVLPLVLVSIGGLINRIKLPLTISFYWHIILFAVVFFISTIDIAYFDYFLKHINASVLNWTDEGFTMFGTIFQEPLYLGLFVLFLVIYGLFICLLIRLKNRCLSLAKQDIVGKEVIIFVCLTLVFFFLCFVGMRGAFSSRPVRTSDAYFCNNSFFNQLGLNATYYFLKDVSQSLSTGKVLKTSISVEEAIKIQQSDLGIVDNADAKYPLMRQVKGDSIPNKQNVVVILMESMTSNYLELKRKNGESLTPYLNSLKTQSLYFSNFYSSSIHTYAGIFSTLYGVPSMSEKNIMKNVDVTELEGLPILLKEEGYDTSFFMAHESSFDNMYAFLSDNGFDNIYSEVDYPKSEIVNQFGVPDKFLFEYALNTLNNRADQEQPFLATILTISNHTPYIVPKEYENVTDNPEYNIVAYADDAIKEFMQKAEQTVWFDNTIFVLVADHGRPVGPVIYDVAISHTHVPCFIYSKDILNNPQTIDGIGEQVDIVATTLGLLGVTYQNNTFGIDLLKSEREYSVAKVGHVMMCMSDSLTYIYNRDSEVHSLYKYRERDEKDCSSSYANKMDSMRKYVESIYLSTKYMLDNNLLRRNAKASKEEKK